MQPDAPTTADPAVADPAAADPAVADPGALAVPTAQAGVAIPVLPAGIPAAQFATYAYDGAGSFGSNVQAAWRWGTGSGARVAVVDDGFDPATTAKYAGFSSTLSHSFAPGLPWAIGEPARGFHGTTTTGLIGAAGVDGMPVGLAPTALLAGVKVSFSAGTLASFAQAELYAARVAGVVNNSWGFTGYGIGQPRDAAFRAWYGSVQWAAQFGRGGLGTVLVFAAGNGRADGNDLAVQPVTADPRVIAVAATDTAGRVAWYSTRGAGLLVAAIGSDVTVPAPGGSGSMTVSGTSYAAPTVAAIVALMLAANPSLGWRDVQEILAASAYAPPPSMAGFVTNGGSGWNGGGMHFSNDLGFGVVDANVAVNLARAWDMRRTSVNLVSATAVQGRSFTVAANGSASSSLAIGVALRTEHVEVTITDTYLPAWASRIVLVAPDGTRSVLVDHTGWVNGRDLTHGFDLSGGTITSNAFWGENSRGTWTLEVQDAGGRMTGTIRSWSLTVLGDSVTAGYPLVFTPEFAALAALDPTRAVVTPQGAGTIDLIALPGSTTLDLAGGPGLIDGVAVTLGTGLRNANADGSTGQVTLTGIRAGGSHLSGGDGASTLVGFGHDTFVGGLGTTAITTGAGGSVVRLATVAESVATIASGGGDTIWAGLATATITVSGAHGDLVHADGARLTFINGSGASTVLAGSGSVLIEAGAGGGLYFAGSGGNSRLTAGTGQVTFYGGGDGDVLTAAGAANDVLIAGSGRETLAGGSATGAITLVGGAQETIMTAGLGRTTFVAGTGSDRITVGGTSSIVQFKAALAGGTDTVTGFRPGTDMLQLAGFRSGMAQTMVATQSADGAGGVLLHVSSALTVDLVGIGRATLAMFS